MECMARTRYKSWFVDFEPVQAKIRGRTLPLPADVVALFPDRFIGSELGDIPLGWKIGPLSQLTEHIRVTENPNSTPQAIFSHHSIPAYDSSQTPILQYGSAIRSQKFRVLPGTILISRLNPEIDRVWLVDVKHHERAVCSTEFTVLRPANPNARGYIYCTARSRAFRRRLASLVTGTSKSHQRAPVGDILSTMVLQPPKSVVDAFARQAGIFLEGILEYRKETTSIALLRSLLPPKLLSGNS